MTRVEPVLASLTDSMRAWALVICFGVFVIIALRLWIIGRVPYERVAEVPLSDDRVVEPRSPKSRGGIR